MQEQNELTRPLAELKKLTGLPFELRDGEEIPEDAAEKITMLLAAWKEKYDRTNFLRNLLYGNLLEADLYAAASRFHIAEHGRRLLYVIDLKSESALEAERILKQMPVMRSGDQLAVLDGKRMILLKSLAQKDKEEELLGTARTMVDMLSMEAMISARVGYSAPIDNLRQLPEAFQNALLALEIGRIFYGSDTVVRYDKLGIGRLIHSLPEKSCRLFLAEVFGDGSPDDFDEETRGIIEAFFENNLNISETARQLYVHRNTLVYRLEKLHMTLGLDLRSFDDAVVLKLAMMIAGCMRAKEGAKT